MARRLQQRQVEAFYTVVEVGTVSAAASFMNLTQPAVSHLIRALEDSIGFKLFELQGRKLELNAEGRLFFEEVKRSLGVLASLSDRADAIRQNRASRVRIAGVPAYVDGMLADALGAFLTENRGFFISLESAPMAQIVEEVENGNLDLGIIGLPSRHPLLRVHHSLDSDAVLILQKGHPLAAQDPVPLDCLNGEDFISIGHGSPFRYEIDLAFLEPEVKLNVVAEVRTQRAIARMVRSGAGIALVDRNLAQEQQGEGLVVRDITPAVSWKICLITNRQRPRSKALDGLIAFLKEFMAPD